MKYTLLYLFPLISMLMACQSISPIFVDFNGVRRDVAQWINKQPLLSMQQKRSLVQLSKAQQKLYRIDEIEQQQRFDISKENAIAMHCAQQHVSAKKIQQLQAHIFQLQDKDYILTTFEQQFPKIKLAADQIQCE